MSEDTHDDSGPDRDSDAASSEPTSKVNDPATAAERAADTDALPGKVTEPDAAGKAPVKLQAKSLKRGFGRKHRKNDLTAGTVLGLESLPDGLATGALAGINPVAGLYASIFGLLGGALVARSSLMIVQSTGAMAIIVADSGVGDADNPTGALATLSILTGVAMLIAAVTGLAGLLRYVPNAVMVGFVNAVAVNIILGQVSSLSGYSSDLGNRVLRVFDTVAHFTQIDVPTLAIGLISIALIVTLRKTRLGASGLVVAVGIASAFAPFVAPEDGIKTVSDIAKVPSSLPAPVLPQLSEVLPLLISALSLAFVGLVQGAGVASSVPEPDGTPPNPAQDFAGQGAGNVLSGFFQGMPVGGSMSGAGLAISAGARTRWAAVFAACVMAIAVVTLSGLIAAVAMPALAGLLMVVGFDSLKPGQVAQVARNGSVDRYIMLSTFGLCLVLPIQYAVVAGVVISMLVFVQQQANHLRLVKLVPHDDGRLEEVDLPEAVGDHEVLVIQMYGRLFFGSAPELEAGLPRVRDDSRRSAVVLRLRGVEPLGFSACDVLSRYSHSLAHVGSRLMVVADVPETLKQFELSGLSDDIGHHNIYVGSTWLADSLRHAYEDACAWAEADDASASSS